jgi:hypothetical protein
MQVLGLVLLAHQAALHKLSYTLASMWVVERSPKSNCDVSPASLSFDVLQS